MITMCVVFLYMVVNILELDSGDSYTTVNIPTFFSEQWFIDYCKNVGASKVCTPEFFNALRVLKLLHLIVSDFVIIYSL